MSRADVMLTDFALLERGSVILETSSSGQLRRYVVTQRQVAVGPLGRVIHASSLTPELWGYNVVEMMEDGSYRVGATFITPEDIDANEGFGTSYVYFIGAAIELPAWITI